MTPQQPDQDNAWLQLQQFPMPFSGECRPMSGGPVTIKLRPDVEPQQAFRVRPIPIHLQDAFDKELDEQIAAGILEPADDMNDPAEWLHPMVITQKKDPTKVRITVDL